MSIFNRKKSTDKKDTPQKETVKKETAKKGQYKIVGGDSIRINENLTVTMEGKNRTVKLTDEIAENLLANDKAKYGKLLSRG